MRIDAFVICEFSIILKRLVHEFAFDERKHKDWGVSARNISESVFGVDTKTKKEESPNRGVSVFDVSANRGLSRLDRGVQSRQVSTCQKWTAGSKKQGSHSRHDTGSN